MPTVLCDLDGTLLTIDHERRPRAPTAKVAAFDQALADEFGRGDLRYRAGAQHGLTDWLIVEQAVRREIDAAAWQRICAGVEAAFVPPGAGNPSHYRPLPGVPDTLAALRSAGLRLGIVTGNVACAAWHKLDQAGVDRGLFDGPVGFGDHGKQRHEILRRAIGQAGGDDLLVLGDTPLDLEGARAVGLPFLGVGTTVLEPQDVADDERAAWVADLGDAQAVVTAARRLFERGDGVP